MLTEAASSSRRSPWRGLRIWRYVLQMFLQDSLVYRANAVIWILTDIVTAVTMPLIWLASYNGRASIHGYSPSDMVLYYMVVLALSSFIESHIMWDMATEVKQGKFNIYLIRPFSFMAYMYASNLGWRVMRTTLAIPLIGIVVFAFRRYLPHEWTMDVGPLFWLSVVLGHFVSFVTTYAMGLLSLWVYEVRSVYNFYYLPLLIFSGQIAPLALFPQGLQNAVVYLPFAYTLAFPANIFLRRLHPDQVAIGIEMQLLWIAIGLVASAFLWRGGIRRYTAFGI